MQNHSHIESSLCALVVLAELEIRSSSLPRRRRRGRRHRALDAHKQVWMQITLVVCHKPAAARSHQYTRRSRLADTEIEFAAVISASLSRYQHFTHSATTRTRRGIYVCIYRYRLVDITSCVFRPNSPFFRFAASRIAVVSTTDSAVCGFPAEAAPSTHRKRDFWARTAGIPSPVSFYRVDTSRRGPR